MTNPEPTNRLKRLRNRYRLIVMNEDTFEEVVKFRLTRYSVYIALSSLFVILVALTASLIVYTPLKYYLPGVGYGNVRQIKEYRNLKLKVDSMERSLTLQQQYFESIEAAMKGKIKPLDTVNLKLPKPANIDD
jgi:hypothetical protein